MNGYEVYVDNEPTLSCVTTTRGHHSSTSHSSSTSELTNAVSDQTHQGANDDITSSFASTGSHKHKKHNTCFTSSVLFLKSGKRIKYQNTFLIRDLRSLISRKNTFVIIRFTFQVARFMFATKKQDVTLFYTQLEHSLEQQNLLKM